MDIAVNISVHHVFGLYKYNYVLFYIHPFKKFVKYRTLFLILYFG